MDDDEPLKACRECLGDIPEAATRCMHCGVRQKPLNPFVVVASIALIAISVLAILNVYGKVTQSRSEDTDRRMDHVAECINNAGTPDEPADC